MVNHFEFMSQYSTTDRVVNNQLVSKKQVSEKYRSSGILDEKKLLSQ
ncbi:hypothetical protein [Ligilactobacillus salitolerans]|nr:hypothetical protein [Ligilactobacillus salitolerans]